MNKSEPEATQVGIIGSGMAGLACARRLAANGMQVEVFDKGRVSGGRTSTRVARNVDGQPRSFDHGAQYFTARTPAFQEVVQQWIDAGVAANWNGNVVTIASGEIEPPGGSSRFVGVPGMNSIAAHLAQGLEVHQGTRIEGLETRNDGKWLQSEDQSYGPFNSIVVTAPAPQAAQLLTTSPELRNVALAAEMKACWAVLTFMRERVPAPFDGAFLSEGPMSWIARDSSKPQRESGECWVLHASPEWSESHLEASREEVAAELIAAFSDVPGVPPNLAPFYLTAHLWRFARAESSRRPTKIFDPEAQIAIAGDWCADARVEGAFLSGWEAANEILRSRSAR